MAKEHVTLKIYGSRYFTFTAAKNGPRGSNDEEILLKQLTDDQIGPMSVDQTSGKKPGYLIRMSLLPKTDELKKLHLIMQSFRKAGYRVSEDSEQLAESGKK